MAFVLKLNRISRTVHLSSVINGLRSCSHNQIKFSTTSALNLRQVLSSKWMKFRRKNSIIKNENVWTIPNLLSFLRMGTAPVVGYMVVNAAYVPALALFVFAGVTDLLDGWIARVVPGQASIMGSFLDPMADKVLVGVLFISLTYGGLIPIPLTTLIISRDATLIGAAAYIRYQSLKPPRTIARYFNITQPTAKLAPTFISKVNTGVQLSLVAATLVSASELIPYDLQLYLVYLWYVTAATTLGSALSYVFTKNTYTYLRYQPPLVKAKELQLRMFRQKEKK